MAHSQDAQLSCLVREKWTMGMGRQVRLQGLLHNKVPT